MCSDLFLDKKCSCVLTSSLPRHVNVFWQVPWQDMFMWFIFQLRLKSKFDIYCILSRENHRWQRLRIFFKGINLCWLSKLILEEQNTHLGKTSSHHIATYFCGGAHCGSFIKNAKDKVIGNFIIIVKIQSVRCLHTLFLDRFSGCWSSLVKSDNTNNFFYIRLFPPISNSWEISGIALVLLKIIYSSSTNCIPPLNIQFNMI